MRFLTVDVQGFMLPEFVPKEIALYDGARTAHYVFKPTRPYHLLEKDVKLQVKFVEGNVHCIRYSSGYTDVEELYRIFKDFIMVSSGESVNVYVKGAVKKQFLDNLNDMDFVSIINMELNDGCPKLENQVPMCSNHHREKCKCAVNNSYQLYNWIYSLLPQ